MKYLKPLIVAGAVSIATIGGVSAVQLFPTEDNTVAVQNAMETISEEVMPKQDKVTDTTETITNPAPLPASEPVIAPTPAPAPGLSIAEEAKSKVLQNMRTHVKAPTTNEEFVQWFCFEKAINAYSNMNDRAVAMNFVNEHNNWIFESTVCRATIYEKVTRRASQIA